MQAKTSIFKGLSNLGRKLRESGLDDAADAVISLSPAAPVWNVIKGAAKILGISHGADADVIAEAMETATPEQKAKIAELIIREREAEYETIRNEQDNITARHAQDMLSDSPLSKMLRPSVCIALNASAVIFTYLVLALFVCDYFLMKQQFFAEFWSNELMKSALGFLWSAAMAYNTFYVGGRTFEKRASFFAGAEIAKGGGK